MMSGHGANPIFFNEKETKIRRPQYSLTPHPLRSIASHFYLKLSPPPPPPLKVEVICVSPLRHMIA